MVVSGVTHPAWPTAQLRGAFEYPEDNGATSWPLLISPKVWHCGLHLVDESCHFVCLLFSHSPTTLVPLWGNKAGIRTNGTLLCA